MKVEDIRAASQYREAQGFFRVTYEFLFRNEGRRHYELNQGSFYLDAARERVHPKFQGVSSTVPILLDEDGGQLSQARIDADDVVYNEWRLFDSNHFQSLDFKADMDDPKRDVRPCEVRKHCREIHRRVTPGDRDGQTRRHADAETDPAGVQADPSDVGRGDGAQPAVDLFDGAGVGG